MTMEELIMPLELYAAAVRGDVSILLKEQGPGVLEVAPSSISRTNEADKYFYSVSLEERNTILHLAARQGSKDISELLVTIYRDHVKAEACAIIGGEPLWMVKNLEGDTPLHTALKTGKVDVALFLISLDDSLASSTNNFRETPLHFAVNICTSVALIKPLSSEGGNLQEDLRRLVHLLIRKSSSATSMPDKNGLTPLLRASGCRSCVQIVLDLVSHYPPLTEQRDLKGRTILHLMRIESYEEGKRVLKSPIISALKDEQDSDGDTPLHLAIKNSEYMKVRVLMESSADCSIRNSYGISSYDLIQKQDDFAGKMMDETDKAMNGLMKKEMYRAAVEGSVQFLSQHYNFSPLSRTMEGNNVLHIAMCPESFETTQFVRKVLKMFPILILQRNAHGNTPLHLAAKVRTLAAQELTMSCKEVFRKALGLGLPFSLSPPWRVKNSDGNTPLHEALRVGNAICARFLIQLDDEVASFVNNYRETPLHVYARYQQIPGPFWSNHINAVEVAGSNQMNTAEVAGSNRMNAAEVAESNPIVERPLQQFSSWISNYTTELVCNTQINELDLLLKANISAAFWRDMDGFTPLLRAAQCNKVEKVTKILDSCPPCIEICDFNGLTVLHHMPLSDKRGILIEISQMEGLINVQDHEGNTPLHLAVRKGQFNKVKFLLERFPGVDFDVVNNDGEAPMDLIQLHSQVPHEIMELVRHRSPMPQSLYGLPEATIKENVNVLLVIAVLLATITFAAGFTVPGGYDQRNGEPILLHRAAFKLFIISDTYAVSCSMLALFSLIWVMTGETSESLKLIDLSVFVLQQSFYGTAVAFVTGVYVTIFPKEKCTAIVVCTLCSVLILGSLKPLNLLLCRIFPFITVGLQNFVAECAWLPCLPRYMCSWLLGWCFRVRRVPR